MGKRVDEVFLKKNVAKKILRSKEEEKEGGRR
jgi:hypothetical protein